LPHRLKFSGTVSCSSSAINQQRVSFSSQSRNELIHYSDFRADKLVFGLLRRERERFCDPLRFRKFPSKRQTDGNFERGGRRKPRANRNGRRKANPRRLQFWKFSLFKSRIVPSI
jgi:hypothetical protein